MCSQRGWSKVLQKRHAWPSTAAVHAFFNSMDREAPLVASAEAKPSPKQKRQGRSFPLPSTRNLFICSVSAPTDRGAPKGSRGRSESPLVASAEAKPSAKQKKQDRLFLLPSTRNLFLVRGFVRLRADEVLSHTGKYPKGAGGGQRVHVSWPPPDPPLLRNSAPLASQGRAQLALHPSLGGPLSPSAQLIPPPAPGRRFIPGVMARDCHGRDTLGEGLPRLIGRARHVPNAAHGGVGGGCVFPFAHALQGQISPHPRGCFSCRETLACRENHLFFPLQTGGFLLQ